MAEPTVQKTPRLPADLAKQLEQEARETGVSETKIIIEALKQYFEKEVEN